VITNFDKKMARKRKAEGDTSGQKVTKEDEGHIRRAAVGDAVGRVSKSENRIVDKGEGLPKEGKGGELEKREANAKMQMEAKQAKERREKEAQETKARKEKEKEQEAQKEAEKEKAELKEKARREKEEKAKKDKAEKAEKAKKAKEEKAEKARKAKEEKAEKGRREKEEKAREEREKARKDAELRKERERGVNQKPARKPLQHKEGGAMTVPRDKSKYKSNSTVATSDEEVKLKGPRMPRPRPEDEEEDVEDEQDTKSKSKGKRKAVSPEAENVKRKKVAPVEESDEDEDDNERDTDGEDEDNDDHDTRPLKVAQKRAAAKAAVKRAAEAPPYDWFAVPERCSLCVSKNMDCFWKDGSGMKEGPKACWGCRTRKIACYNGFKKAGPVVVEVDKISPFLVDLRTPLNNLRKRLAPPAADMDGVPRSGILGENPDVPNTLGELLVDLLVTIRETKEENKDLKKELKEVKRTLQTMVTYESKMQAQVMNALNTLSSQVQSPPPPQVMPMDIASNADPVISRHAASTTPARHSPVPPISESTLLMASRVRINLEDSENEEIASDQGPSSASRSPPNKDEVAGDDEPAIPSVVADRTRNKKKAAAGPEAPGDDASNSEHSDQEEEVKMPRGKKRKGAGKEDVDSEEANPKKKARVPAGKAKAGTKAAGNQGA